MPPETQKNTAEKREWMRIKRKNVAWTRMCVYVIHDVICAWIWWISEANFHVIRNEHLNWACACQWHFTTADLTVVIEKIGRIVEKQWQDSEQKREVHLLHFSFKKILFIAIFVCHVKSIFIYIKRSERWNI